MKQTVNTRAVCFQIAKLQLQPGDILVLKATRPLSQPEADRLVKSMQGVAPDNVKFVLIANDMNFEIVSPPAVPA